MGLDKLDFNGLPDTASLNTRHSSNRKRRLNCLAAFFLKVIRPSPGSPGGRYATTT